MSDAVVVSGTVTSGDGPDMHLETGKLASLANGAVVARMGDTQVLVAATAANRVREGIDFFPLTVDVEERSYAAGKIPRLVLPARGSGVGQRHVDVSPDRPAAAPVVPRRVPQRGARRRDRPVQRSGQPARRSRHQRRIGGSDGLRHPLRRADRRRSSGLHHRR